MNQNKKLVIINNEKISKKENNFYCDNVDMKSTPEGLSNNFDVLVIARKSKIERSQKINLQKIKISSNILVFLFHILKTLKDTKTNYLLISITPYTFFSYLILLAFGRKVFVYLRSDGYQEYKYILGFWGPAIYHIMFSIISWKANLISCRKHILKGKSGKIVYPSQLNQKWFLSRTEANLDRVKLLYIGRVKVEKGIFSLLKILEKFKEDFTLSILGSLEKNRKKLEQKNINVIHFNNEDHDSIINIYDQHNIFVLPSFTEGHPQVLDESLARLRPVIVFNEISHVIDKRKGVFVCKRDSNSLSTLIKYIIKNYSLIQEDMMTNNLPVKKIFLDRISKIIEAN